MKIFIKIIVLFICLLFSLNNIISKEKIDTDYEILKTNINTIRYTSGVRWDTANCPLSPKSDGGYYIIYFDTNTNSLHVLSYTKDDKLENNFDTQYNYYVFDITTISNDGFAFYAKGTTTEKENTAILVSYYSNFTKINEVYIMNNPGNDHTYQSTSQIYKSGAFGMFNMYSPSNAKLNYGNNRIFLIFAHYNWFGSNGGHTGDSVITFNDALNSYDFGNSWGSSHSLEQSVTQDSNFFWSASLGDAYPMGILIQWTSKTDVLIDTRTYKSFSPMGGIMKGNMKGSSSGKLGGLLYSEKDEKYILVFSHTNDEDDSKRHGIYMTTFKYDKSIVNITDIETNRVKKISKEDDIENINAGLIDDKVAIFYLLVKNKKASQYICNVPQGTEAHYIIAKTNGKLFYDSKNEREKLYLSTNEELRNLKDGKLIYSTVDKEGYLNIIKIIKAHKSNIPLAGWKKFLIAIAVIAIIIGAFILFDELYLKPKGMSVISKLTGLCIKEKSSNDNASVNTNVNSKDFINSEKNKTTQIDNKLTNKNNNEKNLNDKKQDNNKNINSIKINVNK